MLKKSIAILLSLSILFCFCACSQTPENTTTAPSESQVETSQNTNADPDIYIDNNVNVENKIENDNNTTKQNNTTKYTQPNTQKQTTKKQTTTQKQTTSSPKTNHSHSFSSANCTTPKTCYCGATSGSALGHSYSSATCFSPKTCSRCGATSGSALGHNYKSGKCTRCGKTDPDSLPVRLNNLYLIDSSYGNTWHRYEYRSSAFTDSFGNVYDGAHCYIGVLNEGQYSTHNLNGQYSTFTGSIVAMPNTSTAGTYTVSIYVDGVLKFSKSKFSKTTGKIDFSVNVRGGEILTIKAFMDSGLGDSNMNVAVVNAQLTK